ncbi:MAG: hypothetical protein WD749_11065 [Phycisphaerales bacterium]
MGPIRRALLILGGLAIASQAIALCGATGWAGFTRYHSEEIVQMNAPGELERAFAGTGLNDSIGRMSKIDGRFAFGWLPSPTLGPEALSVLTIGGPAAILALVGLWPARARRHGREG